LKVSTLISVDFSVGSLKIDAFGFLLGLPLDIRHITFSAANLSTAFVGLDHQMSWELLGTSLLGLVMIGTTNLVVSFGLALWVALRARKIRFRHGLRLVRALGRRFLAAPVEFFIGPKDVPGNPPEAATIKGSK
jgi:site-specific recombinase